MWRITSTTPVALRLARRTLCVPATLTSDTLQSTITDFKAKYEEKYASPYSAEKLALDLKVGSVDSSKVKQMFEFNDFLNKLVMKNISVVGKNNITMTTEKTVDWTYWESVIDDPVVAEMKALHERAVKEAIDGMSFEDDTSTKAMMAEIKEAFEGPDGLFSEGRKAEVAAEAGMAQTIKDLEALESQMTNLKEQTIAEVLDSDPQMREEIEKEMKSHQWGA
jgi:hypothetical protein